MSLLVRKAEVDERGGRGKEDELTSRVLMLARLRLGRCWEVLLRSMQGWVWRLAAANEAAGKGLCVRLGVGVGARASACHVLWPVVTKLRVLC